MSTFILSKAGSTHLLLTPIVSVWCVAHEHVNNYGRCPLVYTAMQKQWYVARHVTVSLKHSFSTF